MCSSSLQRGSQYPTACVAVSHSEDLLLLGQGLHVAAPGGAGLDAAALVGAASLGLRDKEQDQSPRRDAQQGGHLHANTQTQVMLTLLTSGLDAYSYFVVEMPLAFLCSVQQFE